MDQRILPTDIMKCILSFLDDNSARTARLVNTNWFRWIKYDKFDIYFPTPTLLPQIVDRLSTYQYPIELTLQFPHKLHDRDILACIPKLTQLKAFRLRNNDPMSPTNTAEPEEYFKLSTLTNLESLYLRYGIELSPELLQYFPRMRECDNFYYTEELIQMVNSHCPHYQNMNVPTAFLPIVPVSVTELSVFNPDTSLEALTRLTKLKRISFNFYSMKQDAVDLRHITWLEHLTVDTLNITGLEYSHHLTELYVSESSRTDASALLDSLKALSRLRKLSMTFSKCQVTLPPMSNLTYLWLHCQRVNALSLPTTLKELQLIGISELEDISHLVNLTRLAFLGSKITAVESLQTLTKLQEMNLDVSQQYTLVSFSTLSNLTNLKMSNWEVDSQTIKSLTNLRHWKSFSYQTEQETIDNLQHLPHLTYLELSYPTENISFDYKVIEKLPLAYLNVKTKQQKNCWTVLPTLTTLESLSVEFVEEEDNIASLAGFTKLTSLSVMTVAENVTCIHLTRLTTLQDLNMSFPTDFSFSELSLKLTRLWNFSK